MREIKFRAWDGGKMLFQDEDFDLVCPVWKPFTYQEPAVMARFADEVTQVEVLMQYTGLKDKNGKEIYFGDIVKHTEGETVTLEDWLLDADTLRSIDNRPAQFEIVGNKYENK